MMKQFMMRLSVAVCLAISAFHPSMVLAQASTTADDEEAYLRRELHRIIQEEPEKAAEAQKLLDALNQPQASLAGRQTRNRRQRGARRIVNGLPSHSHPAVGALLKGKDARTATTWCTGTLVGCDKFLTAAHCIADAPSADSYLVFFQELGFFRVKAVRWEEDKYKIPYFDLAMLTLDKPVEGIAPMPVNMSVKPLNNVAATIVGFGRTGGRRFDYGLKREGTIKTTSCPQILADKQVLCWRFDADLISSGSAQNTCNADSGGGVFIRDYDGARGVVDKVFGVVSGGTDNDCVKNDVSYNVDVFQYREWIEATGEGRLSSTMCGTPLWGNTAKQPVHVTMRLEADKTEDSLQIEIPSGAAAVQVAMNAEDDGKGSNEFAFVVQHGASSVNGEDMCKGAGTGRQFAFCRVEKPQPGTWTVRVKRIKGNGEVQITTVIAPSGAQ